MSQRIFATAWLILCGIGLYIGWGIQSEFSYEPLGPRPFPIVILLLMTLCAFILLVGQQEAIEWPKPYVLRHLVLLILSLVIYAWAFEWLGFPLFIYLPTNHQYCPAVWRDSACRHYFRSNTRYRSILCLRSIT